MSDLPPPPSPAASWGRCFSPAKRLSPPQASGQRISILGPAFPDDGPHRSPGKSLLVEAGGESHRIVLSPAPPPTPGGARGLFALRKGSPCAPAAVAPLSARQPAPFWEGGPGRTRWGVVAAGRANKGRPAPGEPARGHGLGSPPAVVRLPRPLCPPVSGPGWGSGLRPPRAAGSVAGRHPHPPA